MKTYLFLFIFCLLVTSWLTDSGGPPKLVPVGVSAEVKEKNLGMERKDQNIGNFVYVDQPEPKLVLTKIGDKGCCRKLDFPSWAAN